MPTATIWREHQPLRFYSQVPQYLFPASPVAFRDFSAISWEAQRMDVVRNCFRGPVTGLANLHAVDYSHRDIHIENLFLMAYKPPKAVLGGFGKTIRSGTASECHLGPIHTRAPEINGDFQYSNKIDIWSLGAVILLAFNPRKHPRSGCIPTIKWHGSFMTYLNTFQGTELVDVADLIQCMLAWNPSGRPLAAQVLQHAFSSAMIPNHSTYRFHQRHSHDLQLRG